MSKAPRNRTLELTNRQISELAAEALKINSKKEITDVLDRILWQDTFRALNFLPDQCVDLMIVDPPYNLTKVFSQKTFKAMDVRHYARWLEKWLKKTERLLKDQASIYICADWKTSIVLAPVASKYFVLQNRISWERDKGRSAGSNWKNCLEDIWFFTKSEKYTFNLDAVKMLRPVRAPYRDEAGKPKDWMALEKGKYRLTAPSNVWTDISIPFWSMPENTPHPTQKPEKLIAKLVLASSAENDVVFDPFCGSGTTAVVAQKLNRHFIGIEREKEYVAYAIKRLHDAQINKAIQGYENGVFKYRNA